MTCLLDQGTWVERCRNFSYGLPIPSLIQLFSPGLVGFERPIGKPPKDLGSDRADQYIRSNHRCGILYYMPPIGIVGFWLTLSWLYITGDRPVEYTNKESSRKKVCQVLSKDRRSRCSSSVLWFTCGTISLLLFTCWKDYVQGYGLDL